MMMYEPVSLHASLAAAVGEDAALIAELRGAFLDSARRQADLLARAATAEEWRAAALRLKGLAASFGVADLHALADEAVGAAPGDRAALRRIGVALALLGEERA